MARAILSSLASTIHTLLLGSQSPLPLCSSRMAIDLNKLQELLLSSALQDVLDQAEERQWLDEQVWNLLTELVDVAHDAEDAVDDLHYELLLRSESDDTAPPADASSVFRTEDEVCNLFASVACRIVNIKDRLNQILGEVDSLQHKACHTNSCSEYTTFGSDRAANETEIYGREDDVKNLVDLVLSESTEDARVIAVVGEAGVGKTTLLRQLCNDAKICEHFTRRGWVRMAEDFDASTLKREMIESMTSRPWRCEFSGKGYWIYNDLNYGKGRLEYELKAEKFLVVLDDFSDENIHLWETVVHILQIGHFGSKIILVTRSQSIAKIVENISVYHLNRLSEDSCWKIFHLAYNSHKNIQPNLVGVGKKIVQKCNGLPLSVKMLGTLLKCETTEERWSAILNHSLWNVDENEHNDFPAAVILSYHYLPPQLQSCIAYCSMFHKSFLFKKNQLVRLWMAQGLIVHGKGKTVEEIGLELFDELLHRSFFIFCENVRRHIVLASDVDEGTYIMHHVIHDLAKCISRMSCSTNDIEKIKFIPGGVRHLTLIAMDTRAEVKLEIEGATAHLHAMLLLIKSLNSPYKLRYYDEGGINLSFSPDFFRKFNYLRTLILSYTEITELPDSIGNLKYLRYLALNYTGIRQLPQQLCSLYHLQTLELQECPYLVALPSGIANLSNLRHVDLADASEHILLHPGIGRLSGLQTLSLFYVGRTKEHYVIRELGDLVNLRGELHVAGLHNVEDIGDAESANLIGKEYLEKLTLQWCDPNDACNRNGSLSNSVDTQCRECIHGGTKSTMKTELTKHDQFELAKAESSSITGCLQDDMVILNSEVFKMETEEIKCTSPLQKDTDNDDIISWFSNFDFDCEPPKQKITMGERVQRLAKARLLQEGVLEALRPHVNLKNFVLRFYLGSNLSSWICDPSFCNMATVVFDCCVNCEVLPPLGQLPSLKYLSIREFPKVKYVGREFCGNGTEAFRAFPSLETLEFEGMYSWEEWGGVEDVDFPRLSTLMTWGCSKLKVAPKFLLVSGYDTYFHHEFIGHDISNC